MKPPSKPSKKADVYMQTGNRDLQFIFAKIKHLEEVQKQLAQYLGPALTPFCQVANLANSRLTLIVANASVATQLRFQSNAIIQQLKRDPLLKNVTEIQCKVRSLAVTPHAATKNQHTVSLLSEETADIVQGIADTLEDPKLREIMQRIARHRSKDE